MSPVSGRLPPTVACGVVAACLTFLASKSLPDWFKEILSKKNLLFLSLWTVQTLDDWQKRPTSSRKIIDQLGIWNIVSIHTLFIMHLKNEFYYSLSILYSQASLNNFFPSFSKFWISCLQIQSYTFWESNYWYTISSHFCH